MTEIEYKMNDIERNLVKKKLNKLDMMIVIQIFSSHKLLNYFKNRGFLTINNTIELFIS